MYDIRTILPFPNMILVIILSVRGWLVRKFMLTAFDLGMTKGEWIFLDVEIVQVRQQYIFAS